MVSCEYGGRTLKCEASLHLLITAIQIVDTSRWIATAGDAAEPMSELPQPTSQTKEEQQ